MPAILKKSKGSTPGDERRTPKWLFDACERSWGPFVIDCAATMENRLCEAWLGPESDIAENALSTALSMESIGVVEQNPPPENCIPLPESRRAWLNPPYSRDLIKKFMAWAAEQAVAGWTVCCLVPFDPSVGWWQNAIGDPACPWPWVAEVVAVPFRVRFEGDGKRTGANFPSAIVIFRPPLIWPEKKRRTQA